jgi:hypothetical protein
MSASAADIARLRRMVAEPTDASGYTDPVLSAALERYPLIDADGLDSTDADWTAVYDVNAAAAEVWQEKSASVAAAYDFDADGASFKRSQQHAQAAKMARYYASRRAPGTVQMVRVTNDDEDVEEA